MEVIAENMGQKAAFTHFKDTSIYERYRLNAYQFSAAKSSSEAEMLQKAVFNEDGVVRSYSQYSKLARGITDIQHETWLRVEYDTARRCAVMGDQFNRMRDDADIYPYWIYETRRDSRVRPEHADLEGKIFKIGDPFGDDVFPPVDWNCRCTGEAQDDDDLGGRRALTSEEARGYLEGEDEDGKPYVDPQFRFNPANQGILPNDHSYYQALPSANAAGIELFSDTATDDLSTGALLMGLSGKEVGALLNLMDHWRIEHKTNKKGDIVFQNKRLLTNVLFNNGSLAAIKRHARGFEHLPDTVTDPTEVWARWEDDEKQRVVLCSYLRLGASGGYCVKTRDGVIVDAFAVSKNAANKLRKGLPL